MISVNSEARYIIPFMSEFEILSSTKKAERIRELDTEMILKIFDKLMSITAILFLEIIYKIQSDIFSVYTVII
jgi:hypothetical protein